MLRRVDNLDIRASFLYYPHAIRLLFPERPMNSCRARPVEVIAADLHKVNSTCCLLTEDTPEPARAKCPASDTLAWKVQRRTVEHLVGPDKKSLVADVQYYYCTDPNCDIVYFANQDALPITKADLTVKVFSKEKNDDVNVCYCFGWSRGRIREEIEKTGTSTAALTIARNMQAGKCACDTMNPKGECCIGDVHGVVKELLVEKRG
jgi:hypothetical protein